MQNEAPIDIAVRTEPREELMPGITTVILTFNEEMHIERAIASARKISHDILVVDSYSTDRTVELAEASGARVIQNKWINYAKQFDFALKHGDIRSAWTLRLDADELIGPDLAARINAELPTLPADVAGIVINRRHIFMGRWVKHGGRYPLLLLRLWRTGQGEVEDRWMDEHVLIHGGHSIRMEGEFADASDRDLTYFVTKHNGYATREAIDVLDQRYSLFNNAPDLTTENTAWQAKAKRFVKERIYNRLPFGVGPIGYFLYRYFIQLGFLDGRPGLIYHFMQGLWYRFLVNAKVVELEAAIAHCRSREDRIAVLKETTGLKL
jgi:glycosyltransferase involved in cell wall biosynthesis